MMNVWSIAANSLWILGLASLLALLSWVNWTASTQRISFRVVLSRLRVQQAQALGLFLLCAGLAATASAWWEQVLWGGMAVALVVLTWLVGRSRVVGQGGQSA